MKKKTLKKTIPDQLETQSLTSKRRVQDKNVRLHPILEKHVGYCLYKVAMKFRSAVDAQLAVEEIIAPQFGMLTILKNSDGINQMTLGQQMGLDKATVVKLIDGLEKKELVHRKASETDRREKFVQITSKGLKFLEKLVPQMRELEADFLMPLSAEEKRIFIGAIPKLMEAKIPNKG